MNDSSMEVGSTRDVLVLPDRPERPFNSDCCGNGCTPCVFDLYEEELKIWESECCKLRHGIECVADTLAPEKLIVLKPDEYQDFVIAQVCKESEDALRIRCSLAAHQSLGLQIGQHVVIRSRTLEGPTIHRQYTPISPVDAKGYFDIVIKIYPEGQMSRLVKHWHVGDKIQARGPIGTFQYSRNKYCRMVMLCAGTGVAPMCQVIGSLLADDLEDTYIRLVYACHSYQQLIAKSELDEWRRFWNFSVLYVLSQEPDPPPQKFKFGEDVHRGRLTKEKIVAEIGSNLLSTCVLVCGPPSFEADVMSLLKEIGLQDENIHKF